MEKESKDLIVLENLNAVEVFTGPQGVEKILAQIEGEVNAYNRAFGLELSGFKDKSWVVGAMTPGGVEDLGQECINRRFLYYPVNENYTIKWGDR